MHQQSCSSGATSGSLPTLFEDFLALPLELRAVHVQQAGDADLRSTFQRLHREQLRLPERMDVRLAWAVAFNMEGVPDANTGAERARNRGVRAYRDQWPLGARFADLWRVLTKGWTSSNSGNISTLLDELALSVLCERKSEWQEPLSRLIDVELADQTFEFVYAQNKGKVVGSVRREFSERADSPEAIADEAWARMFSTYWSAEARRRFLGLSRISTLVCEIARYVAVDRIRDKGALVMDGGGVGYEEDSPREHMLERIGVVCDPAEDIAVRQLQQKVRECVGLLPPKQRIVAEIVWLRGISAKEAAESLHISEPAVSQHLKKARERLASQLREHGFDIPR